jgi:hypothetical protein
MLATRGGGGSCQPATPCQLHASRPRLRGCPRPLLRGPSLRFNTTQRETGRHPPPRWRTSSAASSNSSSSTDTRGSSCPAVSSVSRAGRRGSAMVKSRSLCSMSSIS